jgi:DNA-binding CsgD family transcriptional regulator
VIEVSERNRVGLLEREHELALARRHLSGLARGRGQLVVVEAAAGLGKSTLLEAIAREAAESGARVLASRGSVLEREFAFGIVRQWLDQLRWQDPDRLAGMLRGPARILAELIDPTMSPDGGAPGNTFAVLHGLYWALADLSAERPLLLLLDDAHWADAASLRFAAFMQPRIRDLPAMLIVGVRPAEPGAHVDVVARLIADPVAETLRPRALSVAAVSDLAATRLGSPPAPEFAAACHAATGGNPFYVQMLLSEFAGRSVAPSVESVKLVAEIAPSNISRALLLQLASLPPATIPLAKALAVLGDEADEAILQAVASIDSETLTTCLDALRRASVIDPGHLRPRFVHPIVRAAVYGDMGVSERAAAHRSAAHVLHAGAASPEAVAGQLLLTPAVSESWAAENLNAAGRQAAARGAPEAAIAYLERALEEPVPADAKAEILGELGAAEAQLMSPQCVEHLREAMELGEDPRQRAEAARALARTLGFRNRVPEAIVVLEQAAEETGAHDPELSLLLINEVVFYGRVDREGRRLTRERAAQLGAEFVDRERAHSPAERLAFLNAAAEITMRGTSATQGARLAEEAWSGGRLLDEQTVASPVPVSAVLTLIYCDRPDLARQAVEDAIARAVQSGSIVGWAHYVVLRAEINLAVGALAEAEADARASLESLRVPGVKAQQVGILVRVLMERGDLSQAQAVLEENRMCGELREAFHVRELLERRGRLRLAQGQVEEALADLLMAGESALGFDMPNPATLAWRSQAALAHHRLGEVDRARALAAEEVGLARAFGAARAIGVALTAAGLVESDAGGELLEEAVTVLEDSPGRLELARALIGRGAWLRRRGSRVAARSVLMRGLELARDCGAAPLVNEATAQLASAGARPRSVLRPGRDALTPTELRVARLAAEGLSNPEIAQAHFVTLKTVETQLGSCYRKLGITSRHQLAGALTAEPD